MSVIVPTVDTPAAARAVQFQPSCRPGADLTARTVRTPAPVMKPPITVNTAQPTAESRRSDLKLVLIHADITEVFWQEGGRQKAK
ncbi:hypothetical protein [Deinococcus sp. UYEF24]